MKVDKVGARRAMVAATVLCAAALHAAKIPELMRMADGRPVDSREMWERERRPELLKLFTERVYGVRPEERPRSLEFSTVGDERTILGGLGVRRRVKAVGHSRGGKTALLAGATDRRFAMVCSNDSGCSGAKLNHIEIEKSEHIADIVRTFPYWFCPNYVLCVNRDAELDFDQHEFLALVAPRLLCVGSASEDRWAGPRGEFEAARLASPAWELYGLKGLGEAGFPEPGGSIMEGHVEYHLREGPHRLTEWDWRHYLDFAERRGWTGL